MSQRRALEGLEGRDFGATAVSTTCSCTRGLVALSFAMLHTCGGVRVDGRCHGE